MYAKIGAPIADEPDRADCLAGALLYSGVNKTTGDDATPPVEPADDDPAVRKAFLSLQDAEI